MAALIGGVEDADTKRPFIPPMCKWGTDKIVRVKVAAKLSHTGEEYWKDAKIDACIADIVQALQTGGIDMTASCCGHGNGDGIIYLADGRVLIIKRSE